MNSDRIQPQFECRRRSRVRRVAAALAVLFVLAPVATLAAPPPLPDRFAAHYSLIAEGATIAETDWKIRPIGDGRFVYESRTEPVGLFALLRSETIVERSEWQMHDRVLQPIDYRYQRTGRKKRQVQVRFDWKRMVAVNTARGHTWRMSIPGGTLDKLSYVLVLMSDLADGRQRLAYRIADGGRLKTYVFETVGSERIDTALGPMSTIKVKRVHRPGHDVRATTLWCARGLHYLPVKIEHKDRDGSITLLLNAVEGIAPGRP